MVFVAIVDPYHEFVLSGPQIRQEVKGGESPLVLPEALTVEPDPGEIGNRAKGEFDRPFKVALRALSVPGDALISLQGEFCIPAAGNLRALA